MGTETVQNEKKLLKLQPTIWEGSRLRKLFNRKHRLFFSGKDIVSQTAELRVKRIICRKLS